MRIQCMALEGLGRSGTVAGAEQVLERLRFEFAPALEQLVRLVGKPS